MATKKPAKKPGERKTALWQCPNPGRPYTLWEVVDLLRQPDFAQFFLELLKRAQENDKAAIECVNSYLAPTVEELEDIGIAASQIDGMRRCTDSGLLVLVTAQQNA